MHSKKLIIGGLICLTLGIASSVTLCSRRTMKATDLVGTDSPPADTPPPADGSAGGEGLTAADSEGDTPVGADSAEDGEPQKTGRSIRILTVAPDKSTTVTETPVDGTAEVHIIQNLPEQALDWAKPMQEPNVGDVIEIEVLPGRKYSFLVDSADIWNDPRKIVVSGELINCKGTATLMLLSGKMLVQLDDKDTPALYNLYFDEQTNHYVVQVIDPRKVVDMDTDSPTPFAPEEPEPEK